MGDYDVSGQQLGKDVPEATVTHATGKRYAVYAIRAEDLERREVRQPVSSALQGRLGRDGYSSVDS
jgi:hypothetical protein